MNLDSITTQGWILALFIRDDGERFLLGDGWYDFKDSLQHFQPNTFANDIVELQGTDGQLLAGQVRRSASQSFDGYVGDALTSKTEIEKRRRDFLMFFRKKHFYKVIYIFCDGSAIQRDRGYIVDAPSVPEMWQKFPSYHVSLAFEQVNYYEYAEDEDGKEIFAHMAQISVSTIMSGGLVWDEYGAVSEDVGWSGPIELTGSTITINDAIEDAPMTIKKLEGNATQSGTPTPSSPQPIQTVTGKQTVTISDGNNTQTFDLDLMGKNIFDGILEDGLINGTSGLNMANANFTRCRDYIPVDAQTTYTFSASGYSGTWYIYEYKADKTYNLSSNKTSTTGTFTTNAGTALVRFRLSLHDNTLAVQLEKGSSATTFEPYHDYGVLKLGTYQDYIWNDNGTWKIHNVIKKAVALASWSSRASNFDSTNTTRLQFTDFMVSDPPAVTTEGLCSDFALVPGIYSADVTGFGFSSSHLWFRGPKSVLGTNGTELYTWLQANPQTIYYPLATPTDTTITDATLISQLNTISQLYGGDNTITITPASGAVGTLTIQYMSQEITTQGYVWESGGTGGLTTVDVSSVDAVQPIWTVTGPATNPTLTNITSSQTLTWNSTVPSGQTLIVDIANQTATMEGANVYAFLSGDWVELRPGANRISYAVTGTDQPSTLSWNNIVG